MRLLLFFLSLTLPLYWAADTWSQTGMGTTLPIQIEADRMETSQENGAVIFSGSVKATQENLTINADKMTVLYTRAGSQSPVSGAVQAENLKQKIDKILATGNVKIVQEEWVAAGDAMDFNAERRIVILSGNAKAWQDQNMVSGEKIILYLDEGKSVVEGSTGEGERVKAFIYPSAQDTKDSKRP